MNGITPKNEIIKLYENLPTKPYFSYENYIKCVRPKKFVKEYSHLQYNHPQIQKYIVIDLDDTAINILDTNLKPNLLVLNKDNGKGHAYFRLKSFVPVTAKSRMQPQKTLRLITHSINNYLFEPAGADHRFSGQLAKNPMCGDDRYRVLSYTDQSWDFEDFFENIPDQHIKMNQPQKIIVDQKELEAVAVGERNHFLFNKVRFEAYRLKAKYGNPDAFYDAVEDYANKCNGCIANPLGYGEINQIIKSISKWTWNEYDGTDAKNRGVMELDSKGHNLSLQDKQTLGAKYTNEQRKESSYKAISDAFFHLLSKDIKPTQKAVAEQSKKSLRTVKTYWKQLNR